MTLTACTSPSPAAPRVPSSARLDAAIARSFVDDRKKMAVDEGEALPRRPLVERSQPARATTPARQGRHHQLPRAARPSGASTRPARSPPPRSSNAGSRRAAPTRSASTWRTSRRPVLGDQTYGKHRWLKRRRQRPRLRTRDRRRQRRSSGRPCTPPSSASSIRSRRRRSAFEAPPARRHAGR